MAGPDRLLGSCACERNQYAIVLPSASAELAQAQVFFDNSSETRRTQAAPVTAWLRVPLDWYQSATISHFPDESHGSIKRTFYTPTTSTALTATRRQFCGYCGTHLTAWNEHIHGGGVGEKSGTDYLDVTLGSLLNESLTVMDRLGILPDPEDDENDAQDAADGLVRHGTITEEDHIATAEESRDSAPAVPEGLVRRGTINDEDHIVTNEASVGGVDGPNMSPAFGSRHPLPTLHRMQSRGIPYFEAMVDQSSLGHIKRRAGKHMSRDGTTSVEWEVIELDGRDGASPAEPEVEPEPRKRRKLEP